MAAPPAFAFLYLPERMNGERLACSRSPPRGRKPEVRFQSPSEQAAPAGRQAEGCASFTSIFPPTSAHRWRPDRGGLRGSGDVRLGKCCNVRASSERRADPTVLPPRGAPVQRRRRGHERRRSRAGGDAEFLVSLKTLRAAKLVPTRSGSGPASRKLSGLAHERSVNSRLAFQLIPAGQGGPDRWPGRVRRATGRCDSRGTRDGTH